MSSHKQQLFDVPLELNEPRVVDLRGTRSSMLLGPADFPSQIRVELRTEGEPAIVLEFIYYMDPQEKQRLVNEIRAPGDAAIYVGHFSGRIMRIVKPVSAGALRGRVRLSVETLVPALSLLHERLQAADPVASPLAQARYETLVHGVVPWLDEKLAEMRTRDSTP